MQAPPPAATAATSPSATINAADPAAADRYRLALISVASRSKSYPRMAMERGWQGKVEVHVTVSRFGNFRSVSVKTSSGFELLDNEALKIVRQAQRASDLSVPEALRGREFSVDIPVIFDLRTG
jgi:protein TonB